MSPIQFWKALAMIWVLVGSVACEPINKPTPGASSKPPSGGPSCADRQYHWSATRPSINLRHVFCGDIGKDGSPKGLHSNAGLQTSRVVANISQISPSGNGIYNATVVFPNAQPQSKFSTFFPDACSETQVINSITYAVNNQTGPARPWGVLGPSAPNGYGASYCRGTNGSPFQIRMGLMRDGAVNTAFPN